MGTEEGTEAVGEQEKEYRADQIEAVEKNEFGELGEVGNEFVISREVPATSHPADVGPEESLLPGRVDIGLLVGVGVMVAVDRRPPERAALHAEQAEETEEELDGAGGPVGLVAEIAVVDAGDEEHPHKVEKCAGRNGDGAPSHPDHAEAAEVENGKRDEPAPVHTLGEGPRRLGAEREVVRVDESDQRGEEAHERERLRISLL